VRVYEAKAHFSELIERAASGQATVITRALAQGLWRCTDQ